ncbi:unnamed protein product [Eretmochelys imbricata]
MSAIYRTDKSQGLTMQTSPTLTVVLMSVTLRLYPGCKKLVWHLSTSLRGLHPVLLDALKRGPAECQSDHGGLSVLYSCSKPTPKGNGNLRTGSQEPIWIGKVWMD